MLQFASNKLLRIVLSSVHGMRRAYWFVTRPRTFGVHAVALTVEGKAILVKLRYCRGWFLPGGARTRLEAPADAVLRELREEIGMTSFRNIQLASQAEETPDYKRDFCSIFLVTDVEYDPRAWSLEVERTMEVDFRSLPSNLSPRTRRWLKSVQPLLHDTY